MIFWISAALMTALAVSLTLMPLRSRAAPGDALPDGPAPKREASARAIFLALATGIPLIALGAYFYAGQPHNPDRPFSARERERVAAGLPTDKEKQLVADLAAQMAAHPENAKGWALLADAYEREGRNGEAAAAYRSALVQSPGTPALMSGLGEALVLQAAGKVTQEASAEFRQALAADPGDSKARYFLALEKLQRGDAKGAAEDWQELLNATPADAPWRGAVQAALASALKEIEATKARAP